MATERNLDLDLAGREMIDLDLLTHHIIIDRTDRIGSARMSQPNQTKRDQENGLGREPSHQAVLNEHMITTNSNVEVNSPSAFAGGVIVVTGISFW